MCISFIAQFVGYLLIGPLIVLELEWKHYNASNFMIHKFA